MLLPVAVLGIIFAAADFQLAAKAYKESRADPDLYLLWQRHKDEPSKKLVSEHVPGAYPPDEDWDWGTLIVSNRGAAIAENFQIEVRYPLDLLGTYDSQSLHTVCWSPAIGDDTNWRIHQVGNDFLKVVFMSRDSFTCYVDEHLPLGRVRIFSYAEKDRMLEIEYKIRTPRTLVEEKLQVEIQVHR